MKAVLQGEALPVYARDHLKRVLGGEQGLRSSELIGRDPALAEPGGCFVTLTRCKTAALRGCIGSLQAYRPLGEDLLENAEAAALQDTRFAPVTAEELAAICIEVSVLSASVPLYYQSPEDLLRHLRPEVHGVILSHAGRRATFLPQVWSSLPDPESFLTHLCVKAGLSGACWREGVAISTYTVDKFFEAS